MLVFSALGFGHYFPWRKINGLCDKDGNLYHILAYIYGVSCIVSVYILWVLGAALSVHKAIIFLLADVAMAGSATIIMHAIDELHEGKDAKEDMKDAIDVIEKVTKPR